MASLSQISPLYEIAEWADSFDLSNPLGRLAATLFVNDANPGARLVGMFSAYFDASGSATDNSHLVVAGYVANIYQWKAFDSSWKSIHQTYGLETPFHMAEFTAAVTTPERYAAQRKARNDYVEIGKRPDRALDFLKHICIAEMVLANCGFSCIIDMNIYNGISSLLELRDVVPPYALGARTCVAAVHEWEAKFDVQNPVEIIFEKGDLEQDKFRKLVIDEGGPEPIFRRKEDYSGLQAADHYAWEQFHHLRKEKIGLPFIGRSAFKFLLNMIPKIHTEVTREGLIHLCHAKGINPSTGVISADGTR